MLRKTTTVFPEPATSQTQCKVNVNLRSILRRRRRKSQNFDAKDAHSPISGAIATLTIRGGRKGRVDTCHTQSRHSILKMHDEKLEILLFGPGA